MWPLFVPLMLAAMLVIGAVLMLVARTSSVGRRWIVLAVASIIALPSAIVFHNVASALIGGEEGVSFVLALIVAPAGVAAGTFGAGVAIARLERWRGLGRALVLAASGIGLLFAYAAFALVVTTIERGNPAYQGQIEAFVLPVSATAMTVGAIWAVAAFVRGRPSPER